MVMNHNNFNGQKSSTGLDENGWNDMLPGSFHNRTSILYGAGQQVC